MEVRERFAGLFFIIPFAVSLLLHTLTDIDFFFFLSLVLAFVVIVFHHQLYLLFFYDSNSTSALYAGNAALEEDYDPVGQDGKYWDPRKLKLSQVFALYPNKRSARPEPGSCGFVFTYNKLLSVVEKVEFYDYRHRKGSFTLYKFYFSHLQPDAFPFERDSIVKTEIPLERISKKMIFVPLNRYSREYVVGGKV